MLGKNLIQAAAGNAAGEVLGVEDVFSTWLYTGNGSTQTITNGIDLAGEGGLVWLKSRSSATNHRLVDTVRGATKSYRSNSNGAESTESTGLTAFNSAGFDLGASADYNTSSATYAAWTFRKQSNFFDVLSYTGNGSNRTIAHNLGSVPGCIIIKGGADVWAVYHRSLANTEYAKLDSSDAKITSATTWNSTTATSTEFSLGTDTTVNADGTTYVAYLFAHDAGGFGDDGNESIIKCGSYTGNGGTDFGGNTISLGWEPQWVLIKKTSGTDNWHIFDMMRGTPVDYSGAAQPSPVLFPNLSNAESNYSPSCVAPTPDGFKINNSYFFNSASTYIYIAIRRGPMKTPTDATTVFAAFTQTSIANAGSTGGTLFRTDFTADLGIQKAPSSSDGWYAGTRLVGSNFLKPEATDAESFSSGLLFDSNRGLFKYNAAYGVYAFARAPGFFDVVAYTGVGTYGSLPHNLGVTPELIISKSRSGTSDWEVVYAPGDNSYAKLNSSAAANGSTWGLPLGTSTTFRKFLDISSNTYIAYLFATLPGVSKVGSYTGTGTTLDIDCGFTSGARLVIIKRTDSTGSWYVWDTARGIVSGNDPYLLLNSTAAEVTSTDYIDPLSSGFQITSTAPAEINASGGSYIFLAVA